MLDSGKEPTVVEIVRAMKRIGFSYEDIYDILTGAGIPGGEAQLLLDRVEENFEDSEIESKSSRIGKEVEDIFDRKLEESKIELRSELRSFNRNLEDLNSKIERLEKRISELQGIVTKARTEKGSEGR